MTASPAPTTTSVHVDVVSDVVCPWCYIGKRRLEMATALVPDIAVDINWRPYFLNPWIPREGIDRQTYLETKFGSAERYRHDGRTRRRHGRDRRIGVCARQSEPPAQHARLPSPHPVVAQRHRSRPDEAAPDGALLRRRRRSDRSEDADPGGGRLRHGRRPGAAAAWPATPTSTASKAKPTAPRRPASTACRALFSAAASSSPAPSRRNISPAPSSAAPAATPGCGHRFALSRRASRPRFSSRHCERSEAIQYGCPV